MIPLLAPNASQAQQLLMELRSARVGCIDCLPVQIGFGAITDGASAGWSLPITETDVHQTFTMPADVLSEFGFLTANVDVALGFGLDGLDGSGETTSTGVVPPGIFTHGSLINNPQVIRFVPVLGRSLSGYTINQITQTINSFVVSGPSNNRNVDVTSTFRIYGAVVPEPSTLVLLVFAHCLLRVRIARR
jgi:hypothetical protein